jgi:hypothetical protein
MKTEKVTGVKYGNWNGKVIFWIMCYGVSEFETSIEIYLSSNLIYFLRTDTWRIKPGYLNNGSDSPGNLTLVVQIGLSAFTD